MDTFFGVLRKGLLIALVVLAGSLSLFAQKPKKEKTPGTKGEQGPSSKEMARLDLKNPAYNQGLAEYHFTEGMKHFILEDYTKALVVFEESERIAPTNAATKFKIAEIYLELEQYGPALDYANKALLLERNNPYYHMLLADVYKAQNNYAKAVEVLKGMVDKNLHTEETFFEWANACLFLNDYACALQAYDGAEKMLGIDEMIIQQKQKIYLSLNNLDGALKEGRKLLDNFGENPRFSVQQAQILMAGNRSVEAKKILEEVLQRMPDEPEATLVLGMIYQSEGNMAKAFPLIEKAFQREDLEPERKLDVLKGYFQAFISGSDQGKGMILAKILADTHTDFAMGAAVYGDFLLISKKHQEARIYYNRALEIDPGNYDVWQKVVNIDWELKEYDKLVKHTETALELFPNQMLLYLYNGTGYYMLKKYDNAIDALEQGLVYAANPEQKIQFQLQLADTYNKLEEYDRSDAAYEAVLKIDPNNQPALNNYCYYLTLRKTRLSYAQELGNRLMKLAPDNPTYVDTYGWLLYTLGEYDEAVKYLEKAARGSKNATILEHYGDALFKTGQKAKAIQQWQAAREYASAENQPQLDAKITSGNLPD